MKSYKYLQNSVKMESDFSAISKMSKSKINKKIRKPRDERFTFAELSSGIGVNDHSSDSSDELLRHDKENERSFTKVTSKSKRALRKRADFWSPKLPYVYPVPRTERIPRTIPLAEYKLQ